MCLHMCTCCNCMISTSHYTHMYIHKGSSFSAASAWVASDWSCMACSIRLHNKFPVNFIWNQASNAKHMHFNSNTCLFSLLFFVYNAAMHHSIHLPDVMGASLLSWMWNFSGRPIDVPLLHHHSAQIQWCSLDWTCSEKGVSMRLCIYMIPGIPTHVHMHGTLGWQIQYCSLDQLVHWPTYNYMHIHTIKIAFIPIYVYIYTGIAAIHMPRTYIEIMFIHIWMHSGNTRTQCILPHYSLFVKYICTYINTFTTP